MNVYAPMNGRIKALENVNDAVFAKMMGDVIVMVTNTNNYAALHLEKTGVVTTKNILFNLK